MALKRKERNPPSVLYPVALAGAQHEGHDTNKSQFNFKGLDVHSYPPLLFSLFFLAIICYH